MTVTQNVKTKSVNLVSALFTSAMESRWERVITHMCLNKKKSYNLNKLHSDQVEIPGPLKPQTKQHQFYVLDGRKEPPRHSERSGLIRNIGKKLAVMIGALREVSHWLASLGLQPTQLLRAER